MKAVTKKNSSSPFNAFWGWGISTLLLWLLNRNNGSSSHEEAAKYTSDNTNQIGSPVPVVLGRAMIKNPLVSYYGDFQADAYTEEYGMHTGIDWISLIPIIVLGIITICSTPDKVVTNTGSGVTVDSGGKRAAILNVIVQVLLWLMTQLFMNHMGRTTIQKGFKYYLGWQMILCWTGENVGIKKLWMNVYDSGVKDSTEKGVWDNSSKIAWKSDNPTGIVAHIDDDDMFGGVDENGGFIGDVRFYFGTEEQGKDSWMVSQMHDTSIPTALQGLTPVYPMYMTCVIPKAYIGKQATIPEMWFEVVNYPNGLKQKYATKIQDNYISDLVSAYSELTTYYSGLTDIRKNNIASEYSTVTSCGETYIKDKSAESLTKLQEAWKKLLAKDSNVLPACPTFNTILTHGEYTLGRLGDDLNAAEAIYEIFKNTDWGCSITTDDRIDIDSLIALGTKTEMESMGISAQFTEVKTSGSYISIILNHINGVCFASPQTGKITFKLIRSDYDVKKLKQFSTANCSSMEFTRLDWTETSSTVSATYTDASNKYDTGTLSVTDIANVRITNNMNEKKLEAPYFTTADNIKAYVKNQLLSLAYPLSTVTFNANREAYELTIGEPVNISWEPYGITQQVYRVTDVDYGNLTDGKIQVTAIEDIFGFSKTDYDTSHGIDWSTDAHLPEEIVKQLFIEAPYEVTRSTDTFVYAFGAKPTAYTTYWSVWRYENGGYAVTSKSSDFSMVGRMIYGYEEAYDKDDTGLEIVSIGSNGSELLNEKIKRINNDPDTLNSRSGQNLMVSDGEIMSYDSIQMLANGDYLIKGIIRGLYDTVPKTHTAESLVYFFDVCQNVNLNKRVCSEGYVSKEQLELTTETLDGTQKFDANKLTLLNTVRRGEAPSIMANLKFGADRGTCSIYQYNYPATTIFADNVIFKFNTRNKFSSFGIMKQTDTAVTPATDTQNVIRVTSNGITFELKEDALNSDGTAKDSMTLSWSDICVNLNAKLKVVNDITIEILTYNKDKDIYSYDNYEKQVIYNLPRLVGICGNKTDIQSFANSMVKSPTIITIPESIVCPTYTLTYESCCLLFEGTISESGVKGQDGNYYDISSNVAYRIDGVDTDGNAILHQVTIGPDYVFQNNYTVYKNNTAVYYRYRSNKWLSYIPYSE